MKKEIFRKCVKWVGVLALAHIISMFAYGLLLSNAVTYMWLDAPGRAMLTLIGFNVFVDAFLIALISKFETSYIEYRTSIKEALRNGEFSVIKYLKENILKETLLRMAVGVIFQIPYMIFFSIFGFAFGGAMGIEQFYIMDSGFYLLTGSAILGVILKVLVFGIVNAGVSVIFLVLTRKNVEETMVR